MKETQIISAVNLQNFHQSIHHLLCQQIMNDYLEVILDLNFIHNCLFHCYRSILGYSFVSPSLLEEKYGDLIETTETSKGRPNPHKVIHHHLEVINIFLFSNGIINNFCFSI